MPLKVSRILHAGYFFQAGETQIAFDPIFENPFSRNCYAFPSVTFDQNKIRQLKFDAVFISHYHDDHCSLESLNLLDRQTPIYIYCVHEDIPGLIRDLGFKVYSLRIDVAITIGPFVVTARRALDEDVDSIFHIQAEGLNVLNVVDSWIPSSTMIQLRKQKWDLVLWPFQTMRELEVLAPKRIKSVPEIPFEWLEQLTELNPKYLVPSSCQFQQESWSWYNHAFFPISYQWFAHEVQKILPGTSVVRLNPAVSVVLDQQSLKMTEPLDWIQPIGDQNVDYEFKDLVPPATAEIAQKFAALTESQKNSVYEYCQSQIIEKYNSFEESEGEYFLKPRVWKLSIYDHFGIEKAFQYNITGGKMSLGQDGEIAWSTEVPIAKLYAALHSGESLTSMYLRINDMTFSKAIEDQIGQADILEDPLIRCLFTGAAGSYQAAQLKRLKENL